MHTNTFLYIPKNRFFKYKYPIESGMNGLTREA